LSAFFFLKKKFQQFDYTDTDEELAEALRDEESVDKECQEQLSTLERRLKELQSKKADKEAKLNKLNQDLGKAQTAQQVCG